MPQLPIPRCRSLPSVQKTRGAVPALDISDSTPTSPARSSSGAPTRQRVSVKDRQNAAIEATIQKRQKLQLRKEQAKAKMAHRIHSATRRATLSFVNKDLKTWVDSHVPAAVPESVSASTREERAKFEGEPVYYRLCTFLPSEQQSIDTLLSVVNLNPSDKFYDLGCGDGRIVTSVVKHFGCIGCGVEVNRLLVAAANARAQSEFADAPHLLDRVSFLLQDISRVSLSDACAIFIYMPREAVHALLSKVLPRCGVKEGTLIYTNEHWISEEAAQLYCRHKASHWQGGIHCYEWREASVPATKPNWLPGI